MTGSTQSLFLDPALRDWVLIPIFIVMIMVGVLRHYATILLRSDPKPDSLKAVREQRALQRSQLLRANANHIPRSSFDNRKRFMQAAFQKGEYLKDPENRGKGPANPLTDPGGMDQMMNMMKGNMVMFIPQTVIMAWINFFFSGFVLLKLPFPLTIRFKNMLQSGVNTPDLDVRWVSSISWYFLNLFGLRGIYALILGDENAAENSMMPNMGTNPTAGAQQNPMVGQDPDKLFQAEVENLELVQHEWIFEGIEERLLKTQF